MSGRALPLTEIRPRLVFDEAGDVWAIRPAAGGPQAEKLHLSARDKEFARYVMKYAMKAAADQFGVDL